MTQYELERLRNERDTDPGNLGLVGCSPEILVQKLNADGSAFEEAWVVSEEPRLVPKSEVLALLSFEEICQGHQGVLGELLDTGYGAPQSAADGAAAPLSRDYPE